jgi:hypothetical protein
MNIKFTLFPLVGVGPFKFGSLITEYSHLKLKQIPNEYIESVNWEVYSINNMDTRIYTENDTIVAIGCYKECYLNDINLIGLNQNKLLEILDQKPTETDQIDLEEGIEDVLEFHPLGLEMFVKDGSIVSVSAYES